MADHRPEAVDLAAILALIMERSAAAGSRRAWAHAHGLSAQYVSDIVRGGRPPGPRILAALGLSRVVSYVVEVRL